MFRGKKYTDSAKKIDKNTLYDTDDAMKLVVDTATAKFDETVELHVKLGVDSRHADQQVRGAIVLPHGTGKTQRVLVFAKAAKADEAREAGADYVGEMDLVEKIQKENWFDFDVVVATPDMMGVVGRLGKVLGPKGLMPSPKAGTVTMDVTKAVNEIKAGKVEYSTAPSARSPSAPRSSPRTSTPSWAPSSRPSPPPPRASTSGPAPWPPPWAPASRSTAPSWPEPADPQKNLSKNHPQSRDTSGSGDFLWAFPGAGRGRGRGGRRSRIWSNKTKTGREIRGVSTIFTSETKKQLQWGKNNFIIKTNNNIIYLV